MLVMVTDRRRYAAPASATVASESLVAAAGRAARAGIDLIQLRERGLEDRDLFSLAQAMLREAEGTGARTVINDRVDVALGAHAHGAHLPAQGLLPSKVRGIVPSAFLIGRSVHSADEAVAAERDGGCDYVIFGSVYQSASKPAGHAVPGIDALERACASVRLPVLAIGGITLARVPDVVRAGAAGVAAIGLFAEGSENELRERVHAIRVAFSRE
jgi:thiamine-phosphate pyrophosphorylase